MIASLAVGLRNLLHCLIEYFMKFINILILIPLYVSESIQIEAMIFIFGTFVIKNFLNFLKSLMLLLGEPTNHFSTSPFKDKAKHLLWTSSCLTPFLHMHVIKYFQWSSILIALVSLKVGNLFNFRRSFGFHDILVKSKVPFNQGVAIGTIG